MIALRRASLLCLLLLTVNLARGQESQPAPAGARRAVTSQAAQDRAFLRQLADAQRALGEQMQQLRERIDAVHGELATRKDEQSTLAEEVKAMREEVKGLYWESSTVKQQIDALKEDLGGVNANVSGFRTYSGFFIAVMILLLTVIFVLTIRR
jgi:septal ring factor EnvC (AmiA/AmiB activator)